MAEESTLILCLIFKFHLRKNCFFDKNILLLSTDLSSRVYAFSITIVATAIPANNIFIYFRENMGTKLESLLCLTVSKL